MSSIIFSVKFYIQAKIRMIIHPSLDIVNLDIVNKTQLLSWDFIEILYLDIVNDSI